jgi:hypothetical protein
MYVVQELNKASQLLRDSDSKDRESLLKAFVHHFLRLKESDFPEELRDDYNEVVQALMLPEGIVPIGGHNGASYAISNLSDEEVADVISKIHKLRDALESNRK